MDQRIVGKGYVLATIVAQCQITAHAADDLPAENEENATAAAVVVWNYAGMAPAAAWAQKGRPEMACGCRCEGTPAWKQTRQHTKDEIFPQQ